MASKGKEGNCGTICAMVCLVILVVVSVAVSIISLVQVSHQGNELNALQESRPNDEDQLQPNFANCKELQNSGLNKSGVYSINVAGRKVEVYCDMETARGGWTVIQKRQDGSVEFYRNFSRYEDGFGNKNGEYWLGLAIIRDMTNLQNYELRVDLEDFKGNQAYALYNNFQVASSSSNYALEISGFSGTAGDSLTYHNNRQFSTFDNDNDASSNSNCAEKHQGAWWYSNCRQSNLNGRYVAFETTVEGETSITWYAWKKAYISLKKTRMKIRPN